jgi:hypothetical protein
MINDQRRLYLSFWSEFLAEVEELGTKEREAVVGEVLEEVPRLAASGGGGGGAGRQGGQRGG